MLTPMLFTRIAEHHPPAAQGGSPGVSRIQLAWCSPYPTSHDKFWPKLFSYGDRNGGEEVVRILLKLERNDANDNRTNARGKTPLPLAAQNGNDGVMRRQLGRNHISPSIADTKFRPNTTLVGGVEGACGSCEDTARTERRQSRNGGRMWPNTAVLGRAERGRG